MGELEKENLKLHQENEVLREKVAVVQSQMTRLERTIKKLPPTPGSSVSAPPGSSVSATPHIPSSGVPDSPGDATRGKPDSSEVHSKISKPPVLGASPRLSDTTRNSTPLLRAGAPGTPDTSRNSTPLLRAGAPGTRDAVPVQCRADTPGRAQPKNASPQRGADARGTTDAMPGPIMQSSLAPIRNSGPLIRPVHIRTTCHASPSTRQGLRVVSVKGIQSPGCVGVSH